jgi:hypothetical protein
MIISIRIYIFSFKTKPMKSIRRYFNSVWHYNHPEINQGVNQRYIISRNSNKIYELFELSELCGE